MALNDTVNQDVTVVGLVYFFYFCALSLCASSDHLNHFVMFYENIQ